MDINSLVKGSKGAEKLVYAFLGIFVALILVLLLIGIFTQTVSDGTISVPSAVNDSIQAVNTSTGEASTGVLSAIALIIGLVVIVILMNVFNFGKKGKGGLN